jgi:putative intracellular protease/amidase
LADGKPVAATANASTILAEAGVLKGKKYARFADPLVDTGSGMPGALDPRYAGGIYGGKGVVQDGKIITSGACPAMAAFVADMEDGTTEITQKFIAAINTR